MLKMEKAETAERADSQVRYVPEALLVITRLLPHHLTMSIPRIT